MADLRVIYLVHPSKGVPAPELLVRFKCPRCGGETILDAFQGVPVCQADRVALEGVSVIRQARPEDPVVGRLNPEWEGVAQRDKGALNRDSTDELDAAFDEVTPT